MILPHPLSTLTPRNSLGALARDFPNDAGFGSFDSLALPQLCNEAETGSLALWLMRARRRASHEGLLPRPPALLHGPRALTMFSTFQLKG